MTPKATVSPGRRGSSWPLVAACALAGGLAVPWHAAATAVSAALAGLGAALGLRVWRWSGLSSGAGNQPSGSFPQLAPAAAWFGIGLIFGLLVLAVMLLAIEPTVPEVGARIAVAGAAPVWRRLLVVYVAAVGEEVAFRLFLLSVITGLLTRLLRRAARPTGRGVPWVASGLSALAFAAAHLPAWNAVVPLTFQLSVMVVALNCLGGLLFGYAFVSRGIAAAICAHAGADCAVQLLGPLVQ